MQQQVDDQERKRDGSRRALAILLHVAFALHVVLAPYTKVEESWTLHAVHDILRYGIGPSALPEYDHQEHPGPVPRSFIGPLLLSGLSYPFQRLLQRRGGGLRNPLFTQILVRLVLSQVNASVIVHFVDRCRPFFGATVANQLLLLSALQFHIAFWAGRTVPNMLAFPFVLYALGQICFPSTPIAAGSSKSAIKGFAWLTVAAVVLRGELAALVLPLCGFALRQEVVTFESLRAVGITSALLALLVSAPVDAYFWKGNAAKLMWPELQGIVYNVFHGKSAEWGTSPFYAYFLVLLPRLLHVWLPVAVYAAVVDSASQRLLSPALVFIALLSLLGHKEWRFIVYVIPLFNLAALRGLELLEARLQKVVHPKRLPRLSLFWLFVLPTIALTAFSTFVSARNYPGGTAMAELHRLRGSSHPGSAVVHIDVYPAMTGASLFTHVRESTPRAAWTYDRTENPVDVFPDFGAFDYLVTSTPDEYDEKTWKSFVAAEGYAGMRRKCSLPVWPVFSPQVYVLEKRLV